MEEKLALNRDELFSYLITGVIRSISLSESLHKTFLYFVDKEFPDRYAMVEDILEKCYADVLEKQLDALRLIDEKLSDRLRGDLKDALG